MNKVSMSLLVQRSAAIESCVNDIEMCLLNEFGEESEEAEMLRNNWDTLYDMILDLHENLVDFMGGIEEWI